jgi:glycosyltransferase involved in cell wall biosynthesis
VGTVPPDILDRLPHRAGRPRVALWAHHDANQGAVQSLTRPAVLRQLARCLFVSAWQRDRYASTFSIDPAIGVVIGNPYCLRALERTEPRAKSFDHPHLVYASTPFRGLDVLVVAFPAFAARFPGARLTVLSGMELYGDAENEPYRVLFDRIRRTPGMRLLKPAGKLALYECLRDANVFAHPSTFDETFCIAALEARVMEDVLLLGRGGALPEIFGDARFADRGPDPLSYARAWSEFMSDAWTQIAASPPRAALAAAAAEYRARYAPAAVAARFRHALFG